MFVWKRLPLVVCVINLLCSQNAYAHLRWVVNSKDMLYLSKGDFRWDFINYITLMFAFLFGWFLWKINPYVDDKKFFKFSYRKERDPQRFFSYVSILIGVMLIINALESVFVAPDIQVQKIISYKSLMMIQSLVGIFLISNVSLFYSGVLLIIGSISLTFMTPLWGFIDYVFEFTFFAASFIVIGSDKRKQFSETGVSLLRLGIGFSLIILGIHNKLMNPGLGLAFLNIHDFNFFHLFGWEWVSNLDFVFFVGVSEVFLGMLICLGIFVRYVALLLVITMCFTATALGVVELIGHLPLMGGSVILFYFGAGKLELKEKVAGHFLQLNKNALDTRD